MSGATKSGKKGAPNTANKSNNEQAIKIDSHQKKNSSPRKETDSYPTDYDSLRRECEYLRNGLDRSAFEKRINGISDFITDNLYQTINRLQHMLALKGIDFVDENPKNLEAKEIMKGNAAHNHKQETDQTMLELTKANDTFKKTLQEKHERNESAVAGQEDIQNHKKQINDSNKCIEDLQSEKKTLEMQINANNKRITDLESEYETLKDEKDECNKRNEDLVTEKEALLRQINENKERMTDIESEKETLKQQLEDKVKRIKEPSTKNELLGVNNEDVQKKLEKLKREQQNSSKRIEELESTNHNAFDQINKLENKIKEMEKKFKEDIERKEELSAVLSARVTTDNPGIADLSDEFRPTKLAEMYSELYDNEWTDLYEELSLELKSELKAIQHLYTMLMDIHVFCQNMSNDYWSNLLSCVCNVPGSSLNGKSKNDISITKLKQLKDVKKGFAVDLRDAVFVHYKPSEENKIGNKKTTAFLKKCSQLCWLMGIQDPPVILDTTSISQPEFDSDRYRPYTKSGTSIDFVVWPPLLLHTGGPLLCKGVAQGK